MTLSHEGMVTLANILHDFRKRRFADLAAARRCLREVGEAWHAPPADSSPIDVMREVLRHYRCHGVSAVTLDCSRVMNVMDLRDRNLKARVAGLPAIGSVDPAAVRRLETRGLASATKGKMSNMRGFAWVTPEAGFKHIRDRRDANLGRDQLGLSHYTRLHHLVEVRYPPDALAGTRLCAPTFVEGCPSLIYRSASRRGNWGRAVDLATVTPGLAEAVHEAIPFTDDFQIVDLTVVETAPPSVPPAEFLSGMPCRWTRFSIREIGAYL
jgi:hypothetical protein